MQTSLAVAFLIRIISFNIRYATNSPFKGEERWDVRKQYVLNELLFHSRLNQETFIGLQEVLHPQLQDISTGLNLNTGNEWAYIGVGRNDGKQSGEYSPIFYRPSIWELEENNTIWLSETPHIPSKGWDAASIRIVTIGLFKHRGNGKRVLALNTHLDDQGTKARKEGAKLILSQIREFLADGAISGVYLSGDFNSEENQEAYKEFTAPQSSVIDAQKMIKPNERYGNENTYTGFGFEGYPPSRLDYIMVGPKAEDSSTPWNIKGYGVLGSKFDNGVISSDHRVVIADLELK
ncbi:hypothetical protein FQN57_003736 [Myotisia sp. PD_48]|nr:hypothetical protein FQN57_003736 [Myotisia sp. PD_48]